MYNYFNSLTLFYSFFNVDYNDFIIFSYLCNVYYIDVDTYDYYYIYDGFFDN